MSDPRSKWELAAGSRPMLVGSAIQTQLCEPHLHDTFTIAVMRRGTANVCVRGKTWLWQQGDVFLGNPYEVHCGADSDGVIEYDVYYPSIELLTECVDMPRATELQPRFTATVLKDPARVRELLEALAGVLQPETAGAAPVRSSVAIEASLRSFFRRNRQLVCYSRTEEITPVREACKILQQSIDTRIHWADLPRQVGCSRPHFIRLFHKTTGLAPNAYFRQLRVSKALRLICGGHSIADAAVDAGFTDQAHLTREFKRTFGRTPGKIAHDLFGACVPVRR